MSFPPQGNKADVSTLEGRLTAARAGYLDNIDNVVLKTLAAMRGTDSVVLLGPTRAEATTDRNTVIAAIPVMRGTDGAAVTGDMATLLTRLSSARAGFMDALNRDRPSMLFPSALPKAIIAVPAVAADLDFPDIVVAGLPSGITIARADLVLIIGALFDTSAAENQIAAASKKLRIKISTGAWASDDIPALTFADNSLQVDADSYRGGTVLFGATDIKAIMTVAGATYNLRSVETSRSDAVIATGASLELLDVSAVIRVWFN